MTSNIIVIFPIAAYKYQCYQVPHFYAVKMTKMCLILLLTIWLNLVAAKPSSDPSLVPFIINNSGSSNNGNKVTNGNDSYDGNLVNGNDNGDNKDSGNVLKNRLNVFIINNSGNNNSQNEITNGDDDVNGNLVNGNGNGNNSNSGNVANQDHLSLVPFIINNSGNNNQNNSVQNGNDDVDGNLVNGNSNGDNTNSGNIGQGSPPPPAHLEVSTTSAPSLSGDKLLDLISDLLQAIRQQLKIVTVDKIIFDSVVILMQRVRNTLINVLLDITNVLNFLQNRIRIIVVSHLIDEVDSVLRLVSDVGNQLPEIVISLKDSVNGKKVELELIPALLNKVLDLLRTLI